MSNEQILDYDEPAFVISVAARIVGVQVQTLRYYERLGLIEPQRTSGNQRMYSQREVERVRRIRNLMEDIGVNLAGVEVVIRLIDRLQKAEDENAALITEIERLKARLATAANGTRQETTSKRN